MLRYHFVISLISILLLANVLAKGQEYTHYTTTEGLPNNTIYDIFQDSKGYIWLGLWNGVAKYNGYEFEYFDSKRGLPSTGVIKIAEDSIGRIWFTSINSIASYYYKDSIYHYNPEGIFDGKFVIDIGIMSGNEYWFSTRTKGLHFIKGDSIKIWDDKTCLPKYTTRAFYDKANNTMLFSSSFYYGKFVEDTFQIIYFPDSLIYKYRSYVTLKPIDGKLYAMNMGSLFEIKPNNTYRIIAKSEELCNGCVFHNITFSEKGICYIATDNGVYTINYNSENEITDSLLIGKNTGESLFDSEGNQWISTLSEGLYFLSRNQKLIYKAKSKVPAIKGELSFFEKNDTLFIGGESGYLIRNDETDFFVSVSNNSKNKVNDFGRLKNRLFIGTDNGLIINHKNGKNIAKPVVGDTGFPLVSVFPDSINVFLIGSIKKIEQINDSSIIVASSNGLYEVTVLGDKYRIAHFCQDYISSVCIDHQGKIWTVSNRELTLFDLSENKYLKQDYITDKVSDVVCTKDGAIWVSGHTSGLHQIKNGKLRHFTLDDGLLSSFISGLVEVDKKLFAFSDKGLNIINEYDTDKPKVETLSINDALRNTHVTGAWINKGKLFLSTPLGNFVFDENSLSSKISKPKIYLDKIKVNNSKVSLTQSQNFEYTQNNFKFNFTGISYGSKQNIHYRYRLVGYTDDWNEKKSREVEYINLPGGNYTFEVEARDVNGKLSDNVARYTFTIMSPFWESVWFISLLAFTGLSIIWGFNFLRVRQIRKKSELELKMSDLRLKALHSQINPHFLSNALSSIQYYVINNNAEKAASYLSKFSKLMRSILNSSYAESICLQDEIDAITWYVELESSRFNDKIILKVELNNIKEARDIIIPSMLIQPFIENAIYHGIAPKGEGVINLLFFRKDNSFLECIIEDDGLGIKSSKINSNRGKESKGMSIIEKKIDILRSLKNKSIEIKFNQVSEQGGTRIELIMPYELYN